MTQTIEPKTKLYDRDLNLWLEEAIAKLKVGDFQNLDVENLQELDVAALRAATSNLSLGREYVSGCASNYFAIKNHYPQ